MKRIIIFTLVIFTGCSQIQSKQKRAESIAKKYLDSVLNDPHSYESVKFEKLDSVFSNYYNSREYRPLDDSIIDIKSSLDILRINIQYPSLYNVRRLKAKKAVLLRDSVFYSRKMDSLKKNFVVKQVGWSLVHTYRAKNGFGALGLHKAYFEFDTELTRVIGSDNIDK